mgnify:CR=1 FL=1
MRTISRRDHPPPPDEHVACMAHVLLCTLLCVVLHVSCGHVVTCVECTDKFASFGNSARRVVSALIVSLILSCASMSLVGPACACE